jgi:hypothetical protein
MSRTRTRPFPTSRAKTAYGLLAAVCKAILAEPKRYNQTIWFETLSDERESHTIEMRYARWNPAAERRERARFARKQQEFPACGTVACVAGWVLALQRGRLPHDQHSVELPAKRILGLNSAQAFQLFTSDAVRGRPGTPRYAKAGVRHIQKFMRMNAEQLKAKRIGPRP